MTAASPRPGAGTAAAGPGRASRRDRRSGGRVLRRFALAALASALLAAPSPEPRHRAEAAPPSRRPAHAVLVVFGGGVRSKELLGRPDLLPTVREIGRAGFAVDGFAAGGADPDLATEAILTGRDASGSGPVPPRRARPAWPTLLEYVRAAGAGPDDAWFSSFADGAATALGCSDHPEFGARCAPRLAGGAGPFDAALAPLFRRFGRPGGTSEAASALLDAMRDAGERAPSARGLGPTTSTSAEGRRVGRALLEEVDRRAVTLTGAASLDARALRGALTVLRLFRPRLVVVRLGQADVAARDLHAYWDVLRRNDAELARLRHGIAGDPALSGRTLLVVAADLGRDAVQNALGGYGRSDGSEDQRAVAVVAEGPGVRPGAVARGARATADLCPTIGALLGVPTPHATGRVRDDLFFVEAAPPR